MMTVTRRKLDLNLPYAQLITDRRLLPVAKKARVHVDDVAMHLLLLQHLLDHLQTLGVSQVVKHTV